MKKVWELPYSVNMLKNSKFTFALILLLSIGLFFVVRDLKTPGKDTPILKDVGEVDQVELQIDAETISAKKSENEWTITSINHQPVFDSRANQNRIEHILSILSELRQVPAEPLDVGQVQHYGFDHPQLSIAVSWKAPTPGENVVLFGNYDLTKKLIYAFFPKKMLFTQVSSTILDLVKSKKVSDFRNMSLSRIDGDSVIEFRSNGTNCKNYDLQINGNDYRWKSPSPVSSGTYDDNLEWIRRTLTMKFERDLSPDTDLKGYTEMCRVVIKGVGVKDQTITFIKNKSEILAKSDVLDAIYIPSKEMLAHFGIK